MIGYYLSSNNEMCYSTKIQTFSRTKRSLSETGQQMVDAERACASAQIYHLIA